MRRHGRSNRVEVVALFLARASLVLCVSAAGAGCDSPSTGGPGGKVDSSASGGAGGADAGSAAGTGGGAGGHDAGGGAGGAGGGGTGGAVGSRQCTATPGGCLCSDGPATGLACRPSSVVTGAGQQGSCCDDIFCTCNAYVCKFDPALAYCSCGLATIVSINITGGSVVAACPMPTASQHCCLSKTTNQCDCVTVACDISTTEVANCSLAQATPCLSGSQVDACN